MPGSQNGAPFVPYANLKYQVNRHTSLLLSTAGSSMKVCWTLDLLTGWRFIWKVILGMKWNLLFLKSISIRILLVAICCSSLCGVWRDLKKLSCQEFHCFVAVYGLRIFLILFATYFGETKWCETQNAIENLTEAPWNIQVRLLYSCQWEEVTEILLSKFQKPSTCTPCNRNLNIFDTILEIYDYLHIL